LPEAKVQKPANRYALAAHCSYLLPFALPVSRKLLYVEPSPAHPEEDSNRTGKLNAIENSLAALVTIPG
jgi:hypothetical protein